MRSMNNDPEVKKSINTIRLLAADMIEKASSGHPGLPLGAAPMAYVLWKNHLSADPENPDWYDRDRFVLSAGHGSALLYALLHISGYDLPLEELKQFRQAGSRTPGHPEFGVTEGVEATTGPLGQGIANAVGMALAEKILAFRFNSDSRKIFDHYTYVLAGDGDIMEGISSEAASIAGHFSLGKLIILYDANDVSLDGPLSLSFSENVAMRFESQGFHVVEVDDGDKNYDALDIAICAAKEENTRPSLIVVRTTIGYGSRKAGSNSSHGAPLGEDVLRELKSEFGFNPDCSFVVPEEVRKDMSVLMERGRKKRKEWESRLEIIKKDSPDVFDEIMDSFSMNLPEGWDNDFPAYNEGEKDKTRSAGGVALNAAVKQIPWLYGGDADLGCSTKTALKTGSFNPSCGCGRQIHFGVREHAMAAAANGFCYHGGVRPFVATFLSFADYMRPSIRLAALSKLPSIFVFTHDSIGVGEDGPTHQPVEQIASLRIIPGLEVIRPADPNEAAEAWKYVLKKKDGPVALIFTRQDIPVIKGENGFLRDLEKGGFVVRDDDNADATVIATGSELSLALESKEKLQKEGINLRVVNIPSVEILEKQSEDYIEKLIPRNIPVITIEAGVTDLWGKYAGRNGLSIGVNDFGMSAPGNEVMNSYGFSPENISKKIKEFLS
ncbi:MAG: transketolase [bacterium]